MFIKPKDEDGIILIVVNNLIPIVIVLPNETIILKGVDLKVTSFQRTPTMFVTT